MATKKPGLKDFFGFMGRAALSAADEGIEGDNIGWEALRRTGKASLEMANTPIETEEEKRDAEAVETEAEEI